MRAKKFLSKIEGIRQSLTQVIHDYNQIKEQVSTGCPVKIDGIGETINFSCRADYFTSFQKNSAILL